MWFLIEGRWRPAPLAVRINADLETIKREYRAHGLPITAVAKKKPERDTWNPDYDDAYDS